MRIMRPTLMTLAVLGAFAVTPAAYGSAISLTGVDGNLYQQTIQSPCIFSNASCQNGAFPTVDLPQGGGVSGYDALSQVYSGATILSIIGAGSPLRIGIDINQASGQPAQTLTLFTMIKNGSVVDTFSFGGAGNVPAGNNGNGYADYLLANFSSIAAGDSIQFHFVFNNANDGTENVFLIGSTVGTPVPEPSSWILLGSALTGLGLLRRKRS